MTTLKLTHHMMLRASRSFRTKIFLLVVLSATIPALLIVGYNVVSMRDQLHHSYRDTLSTLTQITASSIQSWLEEQKTTGAALARSADLREHWVAREHHKEDSDEYFLDLVRLHRVIQLCNESSIWITEVRVSDTFGKVILSDNMDAVNGLFVPPEGQVDLKKVVKDKEVAVSRIYLSRTPAPRHRDSDELDTGFPTMWISAPIMGEGEVLGILSLRLAVQDLILPKEAGDLPVDVFLVSPPANGAKNEVELISATKYISSPTYAETMPIPRNLAQGEAPWPKAGSNLDGYPDYRKPPVEVVGAWWPVNDDMIVMAQLNRADLTRPVMEQLKVGLALGAAVAALSGFLAFGVAGALLSPLRVLSEAATRLAAGDRSVRVNLKGSDEIGQLARTFDNTAAAIEATLKELEIARDEALAANRAKSRFLSNMTHELRTPLNAIIGYSEMLLQDAEEADPPQESVVSDLQTILSAARHLLELINGILDLSKVEAGKMSIYLEDFPLPDVFHECQQTILPLIMEHGNKLKVTIDPRVGVVSMDRTKIKQVLFNLLSNAAKFTKGGEVELYARIDSGFMWVGVRDNGIGMSSEQLAKIFEEFAQADESTTRRYGGTGLGLAIVKRFVEMMGGEINVESKENEGSDFQMRFPAPRLLEEVPAPAPEAPSQPVHPSSVGPILVIEDDQAMADMLERILSKEGYDVMVANSGTEGLEMMRCIRPSVVTLDVMLPEVSGWTVLSEMKNDPVLSDIPVLMLTVTEDPALGFALGAAEYLTKPVDSEKLLRTLGRYSTQNLSGPILVVDDDPSARRLVKSALDGLGRPVEEAGNGKEALEAVARQRPSVILLDLMMPEMDGFEFVRLLRHDEKNRNIPVLVLTAMDLSPEEEKHLSQHTQRVFTKGDLSWPELRGVLGRLFKKD